MPYVNDYFMQQVLLPSAAVFMFIAGLVAIFIGVGLLVAKESTLQLLATMNTYVSTRRAFASLSKPHDISHGVLSHHRLIGACLVIGACYALIGVIVYFNPMATLFVNGADMAQPMQQFAALMSESLRWIMLVAMGVALLVGILLLLLPHAFDVVETQASRWYSFPGLTRGAESMHMALDRQVAAFPRTAGWVIVAGASLVVIDAWMRLFWR